MSLFKKQSVGKYFRQQQRGGKADSLVQKLILYYTKGRKGEKSGWQRKQST